jgi:hypothetical protein
VLRLGVSYTKWKAEATAIEAKIMAHVPGWKSGRNVYHTTWMPPMVTVSPGMVWG